MNHYMIMQEDSQTLKVPGADRLKISTTLTKKGLTDFNDKNFIEIMRLDDGELKKITK